MLHISGTFSFEEPKLLGLCEPEEKCGFNIVPNNLDDQVLLEQVKNIIVTSFILVGFWKSNLLGASSATLLLNTLRVLVISVY